MSGAPEAPGPTLGLGADQAAAVELPFAFSFYGRSYRQVFVHGDGHLTFGSADASPGERGLARLKATTETRA